MHGAGCVGRGTLLSWLSGLQLWHVINGTPWDGGESWWHHAAIVWVFICFLVLVCLNYKHMTDTHDGLDWHPELVRQPWLARWTCTPSQCTVFSRERSGLNKPPVAFHHLPPLPVARQVGRKGWDRERGRGVRTYRCTSSHLTHPSLH